MTSEVFQGDPSNIIIPQGRLFMWAFEAWNVDEEGNPSTLADLTGFTAEGVLRAWDALDAPLLATFECGKYNPDTDELDALDDSGEVCIRLEAEVTATIKRSGAYDIKLIQPNEKPVDFMSGEAILKARVTQ